MVLCGRRLGCYCADNHSHKNHRQDESLHNDLGGRYGFRFVKTGSMCAVLAMGLLTSAGAVAQPRAGSVPVAGRSIATADDGTAVVLNPANLGYMPGFEARWSWIRIPSTAGEVSSGHAISLASGLPFGLGTGLRVDLMREPVTVSSVQQSYTRPYAWLTWGLGLSSKSAGVGMSVRHLFATEPRVSTPTTVTVGLSSRTSPYFAVSAVAYDLGAAGEVNRITPVDRSYALAAAVRPWGKRTFELAFEGRYHEGLQVKRDDKGTAQFDRYGEGWVPKAVVGVDIPHLGRLSGDIAWVNKWNDKRGYVANALLDLNVGYLTAQGGAIFGSGLSSKATAGLITGAAVRTWQEPGVRPISFALLVRVEKTLSQREHTKLLSHLWSIRDNRDIAAIVLQIKGNGAASLAASYEIDDAVQLLKSYGKKVICHLEATGVRGLYSCIHADRIVINPAGGIQFSGLHQQRFYLAELMNKVGVSAQFIRIGEHKSAPEQFTRTAPSEIAKRDYIDNLQQTERELIRALAQGRRVSYAAMKKVVDSGPFTAHDALAQKLVDGFGYHDELEAVVSEVMGNNVLLAEKLSKRAPDSFGKQQSVAIVYIDGNIVDGKSTEIPFLDFRAVGSSTIAESLKDIRKDRSIGAVVVRVDSPGGSALASDVIWREIAITARKKPVIVSMASVAASGGYYVAAGADRIFATPLSVTGSIGVFYGKADTSQLFKKLGISIDTIKTSPRADAESWSRPFTKEEIIHLGGKVKQFYDIFVDRVSKGRKLSPEAVDKAGRGRVWMARDAMARGLVDQIGGLRQALNAARKAANLNDDAPIVEFPKEGFSLLRLASKFASNPSTDAEKALLQAVPGELGTVLRSGVTFVVYDPLEPLALTEWVFTP